MKGTLRIANNIRLAIFPIGYALSGVLIGSTLNRIMIAELGYSATLVAIFFAIPLMISPIRVWVGYRSDAFPILGKRREPYILLGALLIGLGIIAIVSIITRPGGNPMLMGGVATAFLLYGLGRNTAHNTFQALVADRYSAEERSRAATFYEVATMLGMVAGAGFIKKGLTDYDPARLVSMALTVAAAVFVLALVATIGNEEKGKQLDEAAQRAREIPFREAFSHIVAADPQVRLFFVIVMLTFIGTLAQDVLLEPFGGLVLAMSVGETTGLIQYWGVGVLLAMLASGLFFLKRLGWMITMRSGMLISALAFIGPIAAGLSGNVVLLKMAVFVMGLGTGLAGAGMLSGTLSFTSRIRAGMLLGVWAVANMAGHACGSLLGGMVVDTVRYLTGNAFLAYSSVFGTEVIILLTAFYLSARLNFETSKVHQEEGFAALTLLVVVLLSASSVSVSVSVASGPKYGPAAAPLATPLSRDHGYFQNPLHPAPDYWALAPYYVPQLNEYSCSVATIAAVVNALTRAGQTLVESDRNATHTSLLDSVKTVKWAERMQKGGVNGQVGLTLDQLADVVTEALKQQGVKSPKVEKVRVSADDKATRELWRRTLAANEMSSDDFILIHFTQDSLTLAGGGPYPHISPIGAFDAETGRALVFDVDREYYEPYWVADALIVKAMSVKTPSYGYGGWIRVSR